MDSSSAKEITKTFTTGMTGWALTARKHRLAILNGPLWGFAAFVFHIVIKRFIYREYRRLPYPMPTSSRSMDELNELLVKGIPEEFFQRLDAACSSDASVQITCPKKYRLLKMLLNRYANRAGCYSQFREGDEIAIEVAEPIPRRAGAEKSFPRLGSLDELQRGDAKDPEVISSTSDQKEQGTPKRDKRKIILD
ncbi:TPA: hypothetical protein ACMDNU_003488 [Vibrio cholerae]